MNRRGFLKKIGLGTAAMVILPSILVSAETTVQITTGKSIDGTEGIFAQIEKSNIHYYGAITKEDIEKILIDIYDEPVERDFILYGNKKEFDKILKETHSKYIW